MNFSFLLIFGNLTPLFFAIVAFAYLITTGGIVKAVLAQNIVNIMIIILSLYINNTFSYQLDIQTLIIFEFLNFIITIFILQKS